MYHPLSDLLSHDFCYSIATCIAYNSLSSLLPHAQLRLIPSMRVETPCVPNTTKSHYISTSSWSVGPNDCRKHSQKRASNTSGHHLLSALTTIALRQDRSTLKFTSLSCFSFLQPNFISWTKVSLLGLTTKQKFTDDSKQSFRQTPKLSHLFLLRWKCNNLT